MIRLLQALSLSLVVAVAIATPVNVGAGSAEGARADGGQLVDLWAPEPGWQVVQDHPVDPDLIAVGAFAEPYRYPDDYQPPPTMTAGSRDPRDPRERKFNTSEMPRLVLRCEDGVTALTLLRPSRPPARRYSREATRDGRRASSASDWELAGMLVLFFSEEERVDIDLAREGYRANEPVYLPDPYDTIGLLRRTEKLYYFEIEAGRAVNLSYAGQTWSTPPDAEFVPEGLDDLLRAHRDPCGWRRD